MLLRSARGLCSDFARLCTTPFSTVAKDSIQKINVQTHVPQPLAHNLNDLELIIGDEKVQQQAKIFSSNQDSFKQLRHFLKQYTRALKEEHHLDKQRHTLEFVVPDSESNVGLKRVVCTIGTTGGECHRLVHRSLQGLFREVGLSPNFVWADDFEVPESSLTYEQRKALEDAKLDATVESIKRAQRGERLPESGPVSAAYRDTPDSDLPPEVVAARQQHVSDAAATSSSAPEDASAELRSQADADLADAGATISPVQLETQYMEPLEAEPAEDLDGFTSLGKHADQRIRLLAMIPWQLGGANGHKRRVLGHQRGQDYLNDVEVLLPCFSVAYNAYEGGERNLQTLSDLWQQAYPLSEDDVILDLRVAVLQQLAQCEQSLFAVFGPPTDMPCAYSDMAKEVQDVRVVEAFARDTEESGL